MQAKVDHCSDGRSYKIPTTKVVRVEKGILGKQQYPLNANHGSWAKNFFGVFQRPGNQR
ncbi:hypothetical protein GCM10025794_37360 [Massilia kyonggiensis]